jgi:hypothetical protein
MQGQYDRTRSTSTRPGFDLKNLLSNLEAKVQTGEFLTFISPLAILSLKVEVVTRASSLLAHP